MKTLDSQVFLCSFRTWLDGDESDHNADRVVEYIVQKALSGHFGFFKLVIDFVDGKQRPTAEEESMFEADGVLVAAEQSFSQRDVQAA